LEREHVDDDAAGINRMPSHAVACPGDGDMQSLGPGARQKCGKLPFGGVLIGLDRDDFGNLRAIQAAGLVPEARRDAFHLIEVAPRDRSDVPDRPTENEHYDGRKAGQANQQEPAAVPSRGTADFFVLNFGHGLWSWNLERMEPLPAGFGDTGWRYSAHSALRS